MHKRSDFALKHLRVKSATRAQTNQPQQQAQNTSTDEHIQQSHHTEIPTTCSLLPEQQHFFQAVANSDFSISFPTAFLPNAPSESRKQLLVIMVMLMQFQV